MASGNFDFPIDGKKLQGRIEWWSSTNGPIANTSNVSARLLARRTDTYGPTTGSEWSGYVQIGSTRQDIAKASRSLSNSWVEMVRKENVIISHNANGTGSVTISGSVTGPSGTSLANVTSSGSSTVTLDTIARYFSQTPTITLTSKTETTFTLTWNTSETCSNIVWKVGGATYTTQTPNSTTGTLTITGRSANTSYQVYGTFTRKDSGIPSDSAVSTWTTYQYPYVTEVVTQNLKIGNQQKVKLYNPIARDVTVYMKKDSTSGTLLASGAEIGIEHPFIPSANTLYSSIPNSTSGTAVYYCVYNNHIVSTKTGTYSTIGTEVPTFSNFTAVDNNSTTTTLTGNSGIVVKGYSNILVTIPVANKATANNYATMKSYKIQVGTMTAITKDYSANADVTATQNNANSNQVSVSAIDSRGLAKTVTKTLTIKNYFKPFITDYTATRGNYGTDTETTLKFTINFWNESFGNSHNSIRTIGYRYKESGTQVWTTGTTNLTYTTSGNRATGEVVVNGDAGAEGFTLGTAFDIQIFMTDALDTASSTTLLISGTPAIAIAGNRVAIGGPVVSNGVADFQVHTNMSVDGDIIGDLIGTADKSKELNNYYTSRPTSANITADGSGGIKSIKATSSMTTGKPPADANIIHMSWDNTQGYDSQLAVSNDATTPRAWIRAGNSSLWGNWKKLLTEDDMTDGGWQTPTISSSNITNKGIRYRKIGKMVELNIQLAGKTSFTPSSTEVICTGLPPCTGNNIQIPIFDSNTGVAKRLRLSTTGQLAFWYNSGTIGQQDYYNHMFYFSD